MREIKAVWIPYSDFHDFLTGRSSADFRDEYSRRLELAAENGINRVLVHLRPFGDALYKSDIFPSSYLVTGTEGDILPFDPLELMLEETKKFSMEFEGWINPFRVRAPSIAAADASICHGNPVHRMLDTGGAIKYRNSITYNPASTQAVEMIVNGLIELCSRYPLDGIHFDDYFYPGSDPYFDMDSFCEYKLAGGGLSQAAWRRQNVSLFLKACYGAVHGCGNIRFGISPKGYMDCNYNEEFLDLSQVMSRPGYVDYVCPQAYFALSDELSPFSTVMKNFEKLNLAGLDLIAGLAVYKLGRPDIHAGEGSDEWLCGENILSKMVSSAREIKHYSGYSLYNFKAAFLPSRDTELRIRAEMASLNSLT